MWKDNKVSLITVTFNSGKTLRDTIESVIKQDYPNIEYIIVDGMSEDNTMDIVKAYSKHFPIKWLSEPDKGLYDAMNKGIKIAKGDVVGIINSDDFYHRSDAISKVANEFNMNPSIDCIFADVRYVRPNDLNKTVRYYSSRMFTPNKFKRGFMPAHPTFFVRRKYFEKLGYYNIEYQIASDFELLLRYIYRHGLKYKYLSIDLLKMRLGGLSTKSIMSNYVLNREIVRACKENGIKTNLGLVLMKYFIKAAEVIITRN